MHWKPTLALAAILLTGGCMTTTGTSGPTSCALWRPVSWSERDTPRTIEEIKINNARRAGFCK